MDTNRLGPHSQLWGEKEKEVSLEPRVGQMWVCGDWLTGYTACIVRQSIYSDMKLGKFQFANMVPQQEQLHLGPRRLFQQCYCSSVTQNFLCGVEAI